jgi:DNA-binding NtrC family response regulator
MDQQAPTTLDLAGLFQETGDPFFAVNARLRVVFLNRACANLLGVASGELLGVECKSHGPSDAPSSAELAAQLRPTPEAMAGMPGQSHLLWVNQKGDRSWRTIQWLPVAGPDGSVALVLGRIGGPEDPVAGEQATEPLRQALARMRERHHKRFGFDAAVGACPAMLRALEQVKLASQANTCVLLSGEPGVGKEHLARIIHAHGRAPRGPLVAADCNLPPDALAVLLTEQAHPTRTLYLMEPARLPRDHQALVLNLHQHEGVRLLAGTSTDLADAVGAGELLPELHCALTTLVITLPPLRERQQDLPLLAQHFLERCNGSSEHQVTGLTQAALHLVASYPWPGNLDEFQDVLRQAHSRCRKAELDVADFAMAVRAAVERDQVSPQPPGRPLPLDELLAVAERRLIQLAVREARGNLTKAAARLDISRPRLHRRMQQLGLADTKEEPSPGAESEGGAA